MKRLKEILAIGIITASAFFLKSERTYNKIAEAEKISSYSARIQEPQKALIKTENDSNEKTIKKTASFYPSIISTYFIPREELNPFYENIICPKENMQKTILFEIPDWNYFLNEKEFITNKQAKVPGHSYSLFPIIEPSTETKLASIIKDVAEKRFYKEIRRWGKKILRNQFKKSPSMKYSFFEERIAQINRIGRESYSVDEEYRDEIKEEIFKRSYRLAEPELPLFTLGPLTFTDSGSILFNAETLAYMRKLEDKIEIVEKTPAMPSSPQQYRFDIDLKFSLKPNKAFKSGNINDLIGRCGAIFSVDFLSKILNRKLYSIELSLESNNPFRFKPDDFAAFFNFVIESR